MKAWLNHVLSDFYHKYLDDVVGIGGGAFTSWVALDIHLPFVGGVLEAILKGFGIFFGGFVGWLGKEAAVWSVKKVFGKTSE